MLLPDLLRDPQLPGEALRGGATPAGGGAVPEEGGAGGPAEQDRPGARAPGRRQEGEGAEVRAGEPGEAGYPGPAEGEGAQELRGGVGGGDEPLRDCSGTMGHLHTLSTGVRVAVE